MGYNTGSKAVNYFKPLAEDHKFPEDFVELAQRFGYKNTNILGAWTHLIRLVNDEGIKCIYEEPEIKNPTEYAIFGTLALLKVVLNSKTNEEKIKILNLIRKIQKIIGGNLNSIKSSGDLNELDRLTKRIHKQLKMPGVTFDEYEVIQVIQKILPSINK